MKLKKELLKNKKNIFGIPHGEKKLDLKDSSSLNKSLNKLQKSNRVKSKFDVYKKQAVKGKKINQIFFDFLLKAGYEKTPEDFHKSILITDIVILSALVITIIIAAIVSGSFLTNVLILLLFTITLVGLAIYLLSLLCVFIFIDLKVFKRTTQIEEVLPDFLQLASANISAGMPLDRALWFAVRPRFGVLAKEMEEIAKSTFTGDDLSDDLLLFAKKYNSRILRESVNLIVAGMRSGSEIAELLSKIAENIRQVRLMKKEIAASVMTYVIFIAAASLGAAPILFALSGQLLSIITSITSGIDLDTGGMSTGFSMSFSNPALSMSEFTIFAAILLSITATFSALIVTSIRKGNTKDAIKVVPIYIVIALVLFFAALKILSIVFAGFI